MSMEEDVETLQKIATRLGTRVIILQDRIKEMSDSNQEKVSFWYLNEHIFPLFRDLIALIHEIIGLL